MSGAAPDILSSELFSELGSASGGSFAGSPVVITVFCLLAAVLPFAVLSVTSFVKLSVVFAILRSALGAGQIPSAAVSTLLACVLSIHIMSPVFEQSVREMNSEWVSSQSSKDSSEMKFTTLLSVLKRGSEPFREFMEKHSRAKERVFFGRLEHAKSLPKNAKENLLNAVQQEPAQAETIAELPFRTLIPAFVISQLKEAFLIGFVIYIPFLIIDLLTANILVGLGMMMVSPVAISLPFKIMLFVAADGWFNLCKGLVFSY